MKSIKYSEITVPLINTNNTKLENLETNMADTNDDAIKVDTQKTTEATHSKSVILILFNNQYKINFITK